MKEWQLGAMFPEQHVPITPDDDVPLPQPMIVYALTDGDVTIVDKNGTAVTYSVLANWYSPIPAVYVMESTNATVVGIY